MLLDRRDQVFLVVLVKRRRQQRVGFLQILVDPVGKVTIHKLIDDDSREQERHDQERRERNR